MNLINQIMAKLAFFWSYVYDSPAPFRPLMMGDRHQGRSDAVDQHEKGGIHSRMSDRGWIHALQE